MIVAEGTRVRLRNIGIRDLRAASAHRFTLSIVEPATNLKRLRVLHERHGFWTEDAGAVAIEAVDAKRLLGTLQFYRAGPTIHGYEIGYLLHDDDDKGKGYASEAVRLFSDYLFAERPACHRLQLIIGTEDFAAARLAEVCGYASEGTLRKAAYADPDEPADAFIYSRVRD